MSSGGDGILTITGFGRFEKLHAAYNKLLAANDKLQNELKKVKAESEKADRAQSDMLDGMSKKVLAAASTYLSLQSAISLAAAAHEDYKNKANDAADISLKVAQAQRELVFNLGADATNAQRLGILRAAKEIGRGGMGEADANLAMSQITGAIRNPNPAVREQVAGKVLKLVAPYYPEPGRGQEAGQFGASVLNIQSAVPELTEEQSLIIAQTLLGTSQLKGVSNVKALTRGVNAAANSRRDVTDKYLNLLQTMAIGGAFTQSLGDTEGQLSATATANFVATFDKVTGGKYKKMPIGDAYRLAAKEMPGFTKAMEENLGGEAVTKGAQRDLFQQGFTDANARAIEGAFAVTPQQMDQMFRFAQNGTPEQQRSTVMNRSVAANEQALSDRLGDAGAVRRILFGGGNDKGYFGANEGYLNQTLREWNFTLGEWMGRDPKQMAVEILQQDARVIRRGIDWNSRSISEDERTRMERRIQDAERRASEIRDLGQAIQDNTNLTVAGQNSQNAAAQRNAQVE